MTTRRTGDHLLRFHVNVMARPRDVVGGEPLELRGVGVRPLRGGDGGPPAPVEALPVSFEEAFAALGRLPRLDAEPDGFFVIAGDHDGGRWQVDGHLFDFDGRLHRVEIHGACPAAAFDALLRCLGWPATPLAFELVREGVAVDEEDFRRWAAAADAR